MHCELPPGTDVKMMWIVVNRLWLQWAQCSICRLVPQLYAFELSSFIFAAANISLMLFLCKVSCRWSMLERTGSVCESKTWQRLLNAIFVKSVVCGIAVRPFRCCDNAAFRSVVWRLIFPMTSALSIMIDRRVFLKDVESSILFISDFRCTGELDVLAPFHWFQSG